MFDDDDGEVCLCIVSSVSFRLPRAPSFIVNSLSETLRGKFLITVMYLFCDWSIEVICALNQVYHRRFSIKCSSSKPEDGVDSAPSLSSSSSSPSTSEVPIDTSSYNLYTVLGGIGMLDTAYLTYLKLTGSDAFCPVGGGGACGDVLNSDYALVFGWYYLIHRFSFDSRFSIFLNCAYCMNIRFVFVYIS